MDSRSNDTSDAYRTIPQNKDNIADGIIGIFLKNDFSKYLTDNTTPNGIVDNINNTRSDK
tara:strand:- start:197 stop:376 length:180 start_codon:yes stop_codon:yes gene_type:complete